jgi:hypothetical protein
MCQKNVQTLIPIRILNTDPELEDKFCADPELPVYPAP